ncbi:hypothetical protein RMAECT_0504 [Rickettsia rhipicephali str. Ect]|uniref:Uncharacterized protein n=1 Tax=Rickettsia rhipicephali str. Ect TaxID=1359199 RepID=A0A0F3PEI5_RICRH|nr:hypothetical protein RMAECT_0504 [Rickettsia rhipicephali str. Ect]
MLFLRCIARMDTESSLRAALGCAWQSHQIPEIASSITYVIFSQ